MLFFQVVGLFTGLVASISARLDQQPHYRLVALMSGYAQRRDAAIRRLVDVSARLNQQPNYRLVAVLSGQVHRC